MTANYRQQATGNQMGIYSKHIFPRILDLMLGAPEMDRYRRAALAAAHGRTLEIGFGTGLNLAHYPPAVTDLTVIDSEDMLRGRVEKRIAACPIPVTRMQIDAQGRLPFEDRSFDAVVTTLTLCSIENTAPALAEIRRVLKPEGEFVFWEHGRSDDPDVARRQDRFNPLQRIIGAGCNLNRPIDRLIREAGFEIRDLDRFLMPKSPRILAEMYRGVAASR
ncbi:MAG: class I SAM-dependent methyltransferase [Blastocatellia bacterium]